MTIGARQVVVGKNFRFGRRREGNLETLRQLGSELGFATDAAELLQADKVPISSSRIREAVRVGDLKHAAELLGRPHTLRGLVVAGDQRGRELGYPTANLDRIEEMLPPTGVYVGRVRVVGEDAEHDAIANIGTRPTVDGSGVSVEVHLLDFDGNLYDRALELRLLARVRSEQRFESLQALRQQIELDVVEAARLLRATGGA